MFSHARIEASPSKLIQDGSVYFLRKCMTQIEEVAEVNIFGIALWWLEKKKHCPVIFYVRNVPSRLKPRSCH